MIFTRPSWLQNLGVWRAAAAQVTRGVTNASDLAEQQAPGSCCWQSSRLLDPAVGRAAGSWILLLADQQALGSCCWQSSRLRDPAVGRAAGSGILLLAEQPALGTVYYQILVLLSFSSLPITDQALTLHSPAALLVFSSC